MMYYIIEPPISERRSGRLWEVVVYKNQTTGRLFQEEAQAHLLHGRMSKLQHV